MMGFVNFGEVALSKKIGKLENVVLYFFACGLIGAS
jgi:hypothetical protein